MRQDNNTIELASPVPENCVSWLLMTNSVVLAAHIRQFTQFSCPTTWELHLRSAARGKILGLPGRYLPSLPKQF